MGGLHLALSGQLLSVLPAAIHNRDLAGFRVLELAYGGQCHLSGAQDHDPPLAQIAQRFAADCNRRFRHGRHVRGGPSSWRTRPATLNALAISASRKRPVVLARCACCQAARMELVASASPKTAESIPAVTRRTWSYGGIAHEAVKVRPFHQLQIARSGQKAENRVGGFGGVLRPDQKFRAVAVGKDDDFIDCIRAHQRGERRRLLGGVQQEALTHGQLGTAETDANHHQSRFHGSLLRPTEMKAHGGPNESTESER